MSRGAFDGTRQFATACEAKISSRQKHATRIICTINPENILIIGISDILNLVFFIR